MYQNRASELDSATLTPAEAALTGALVDALPSQAAVLDARGRIVVVNKAWEQLAATHRSGPFAGTVEQNFLALCRAEDGESAAEASRLAAGIRAVLIGSQAACRLGYACHVGGEIVWLRVHVAAFSTGAWAGALMTLANLSDVASGAPAGEARYRAAFDGNTLPMWVFDPATLRFLEVNEAAVAYYGYSRAEFLAMTLADIRPPDDVRTLGADVEELETSARNVKVWRHLLKSGRIVRTEIHAQWLPWAGASARLVTTIDVTERLRAAEALAESERRFRELANAISEVFWLSELDSKRLLYVSPAYEKIWGRSTAELYLNPGLWLESVHPDDRARVARAAKAFPAQPYSVEYRVLRPDGSLRWVSDTGFAVCDEAGTPRRMAAVAQDITKRKLMAEQSRQSQHLEALGQLTGGVAHDFNNLLTVIQGNAELLTELLVAQPRLHKLAALIGDAAERSAELTRRLLAFARKQALDPKAVDLNPLLAGLEALLRRSLGGHIKIDLILAADLWLTRVDPGQLENAVLNLAINARDAMPDGGRLTIRTQNIQLDEAEALRCGLGCDGRYVLLTVKDTGTGIAIEHLPHVFEPFFTTKETGKGTGLGLAMAYGFVNQSLGHISVESAPGAGTQLSIYLPQLSDAPAAARPAAVGDV
ncbi:MAG: Blue-light-activated protein [Hydrocarboniphaga sp.]|uniref:PAS domain-containing sensor histidine kinase n=1 Tax=Hydrocarboniphaga sp. TaxID=2033016 RepID=UPI00263560D7|nr:hybrid sensor histidine kinase/response regulator [Hydrocarboniphaga sp.]MDB5969151.1 Blue-light-activated protein [Hydrocarboniphaga sp.]